MNEREQTTLRLPRELKKALEERAEMAGVSFNGLVVILLNRYRSDRERSQTVRHA